MSSDDNPYAPPQSDLRPTPQPPPEVDRIAIAWRDGEYLVLDDAADLSPRCARCGLPAEARLRLELVVEGQRLLWVGLCARHRRGGSLIRWLVVPTLLATTFGSGWIVVIASQTMTLSWTIGLGLIAFVLLVLLFLIGEKPLITFEGLEPVRSARPYVRLGGLHPGALEGLTDWPGPDSPTGNVPPRASIR